MVSARHYTVDPMLSASGNLFKCHEEVLFYFYTCCIGIPEQSNDRGGEGIGEKYPLLHGECGQKGPFRA